MKYGSNDTMSRKWTENIGVFALTLARYRLLASQII